ncbi:MAG: hypothetical protein K0U38_02275 [Epsilonproteobacteria bacterium]|nr:hypothetical protein [Campylobacterota bacterium]
MFKRILINSIGLLFLGCGADSELLKDDTSSVGGKPKGNAYEILNSRVYNYYMFDENRIGFEYMTLSEECSNDLCYLIEDNYLLFNGESKKNSVDNKVVLSTNGWYQKSEHDECSLTFSGSKITERCPDGTERITTITESNLEEMSIVDELNTTAIGTEKLKDSEATFTHDTVHYDFKETNSHVLYEIIDGDDSQCYTSKAKDEVLEDDNLSKSPTIVCSIDGMTLSLQGAKSVSGFFTVDDIENTNRWEKSIRYKHYPVIELNITTDDKRYFISSYQGVVRIGEIISKEQEKSYINTEAFNAIYAQLNNEYTSESITYQKLQTNYYKVGFYGGDKAYKRFFVDEDDNLNMEYRSFVDDEVAANWILSDSGLKRESLVCDSEFIFHGYSYICDDGRMGEVSFLEEKTLQNELISNYLSREGVNFSLENKNKFFSIDAKELSFKYHNKSGENYLFNVDNSHNIGVSALMDDASTLLSNDLFMSRKDRGAYAKIIGVSQGDSGIVEIYELNSSIEDNKLLSLASAKKIDEIAQWQKKSFGGRTIIEIENSEILLKYFDTNKNITLVEFMLTESKVISGINYEKNGEFIKKYLNLDAYENIVSNVE